MEAFDYTVGLVARNPRFIAILVWIIIIWIVASYAYSWFTTKGSRFARIPGMKEYGRSASQYASVAGGNLYGGVGRVATVTGGNPALESTIASAPIQDMIGNEVTAGFTAGRQRMTSSSVAALQDIAGQRMLGNMPIKNFAPKTSMLKASGEVPF